MKAVICMRVTDIDEQLPGSEIKACVRCGEALLVSGSSLVLGMEYLCLQCAGPRVGDVVIVRPEQVAELRAAGLTDEDFKLIRRGAERRGLRLEGL